MYIWCSNVNQLLTDRAISYKKVTYKTVVGKWKVSLFESLEDKVCGDEANGEAAPDEHTHQKEAVAEG
jgi:hypothetical protein